MGTAGGRGRSRAARAGGAAGSVAALVALGLAPLVAGAPARADEFDWLTDLCDPASWSTPAAEVADPSAVGALDPGAPALGAPDPPAIGSTAW